MKLTFKETDAVIDGANNLSDAEFSELEFYFSQLCGMDEAQEILAAISHGCLLFREYSEETGYYFQSPLPLSDSADISSAFVDIAEYCRLEAIPEVLVGIPEEELDCATRGVLHKELYSLDDGTYFLRVNTECMLSEELPELMYEDIYLGEFASVYADDYERLVTDKMLNRFYGYSITDDIIGGCGMDYIKEVRREFDAGEAMGFAVTVLSEENKNVFIGEGTLYAFDGRGGASMAFRVLPDWQGKGYGKKIFCALRSVARELGLRHLFAEVMKENIPSLSLLSSFAGVTHEENNKIYYKFAL